MNDTIVTSLFGSAQIGTSPISFMLVVSGLAMIPFAFLAFTSFVKLSIVFAVLRSAIGAGGIPSTALTSLLSLVLTLHIMQPTLEQAAEKVTGALGNTPAAEQGISVASLKGIVTEGIQPLREFLLRQSDLREREFFAGFRSRHDEPGAENNSACVADCPMPGESIFSLVAAFLITELREAFAIGFMIFLPFLVIDLVIANLLVGMGMLMVSPVTISLPFKIVLFVVCDGWYLLCHSLMAGYS